MHFTICVPFEAEKQNKALEENISKLLENFVINKVVEPYKEYLTQEAIEKISKYYHIDSTHSDQIADKIMDWNGNKGGVDNNRIYQVLRKNPAGRFDYWKIYDVVYAQDIVRNGQVYQGIVTPEGKLIEGKEYFLQFLKRMQTLLLNGNKSFMKILCGIIIVNF